MSALDERVLDIDYEREAERIAARLRDITARTLHRRGLVVAISGGIDSSVCAALAVRALGASRVFCLILPERDSDADSAAPAAGANSRAHTSMAGASSAARTTARCGR